MMAAGLRRSHAVQAPRAATASRARCRVTCWPACKAGLRRRRDVAFRLDLAAVAGGATPRRTAPGGQPICSDLAVELVPTLRLVFHLTSGDAGPGSRDADRLGTQFNRAGR